MKIKLPFKKNALYSDYNFSLKYPIDYRYLSFNHQKTLRIIAKIQKPFWKIQNALNDLRIDLIVFNVRFLEFCSCKEIKKQEKEYYNKWVLE